MWPSILASPGSCFLIYLFKLWSLRLPVFCFVFSPKPNLILLCLVLFLKSVIKMQFTWCKAHPFKVHKSIILCIFTELWNTTTISFLNISIIPQKKPHTLAVTPYFPPNSSSLWQPVIDFLSLWTCLFWILESQNIWSFLTSFFHLA